MEHSYVQIEVYDLPGRLVKHLVSQDLTPASYTVAWDGTDNSGRIAASGVYYARMTATPYPSTRRTESFHATRKLMLVR
jgi:flagellar hook assembly protein FlgD